MPIWIAIQTFIFTVAVPLVRQILQAFGIGAVVFSGLTVVLEQLKQIVLDQFAGLPSDIVLIIGLMKIDVAFNIILSSILARMILSGINSTTGKKKTYSIEA
jgi:hypothetical protein